MSEILCRYSAKCCHMLSIIQNHPGKLHSVTENNPLLIFITTLSEHINVVTFSDQHLNRITKRCSSIQSETLFLSSAVIVGGNVPSHLQTSSHLVTFYTICRQDKCSQIRTEI